MSSIINGLYSVKEKAKSKVYTIKKQCKKQARKKERGSSGTNIKETGKRANCTKRMRIKRKWTDKKNNKKREEKSRKSINVRMLRVISKKN